MSLGTAIPKFRLSVIFSIKFQYCFTSTHGDMKKCQCTDDSVVSTKTFFIRTRVYHRTIAVYYSCLIIYLVNIF